MYSRNKSEVNYWSAITDIARWCLQHSEKLKPKDVITGKGSPYLRLWEYPAFAPNCSWSAFLSKESPIGKREAIVRRITWRTDIDLERQRNIQLLPFFGKWPEPTLEIVDAELPFQQYQQLMHEGEAMSFPAICADTPWGLDGISSGIDYRQHTNNIQFEWWCDGPKEWLPIIAWADKVKSELNECLAEAKVITPVRIPEKVIDDAFTSCGETIVYDL